MKKKHLLSFAALAIPVAVIATPLQTPVSAASTISATIYSINGQNVSLDFDTFTEALNAGVLNDLNIRYIQIGDSYYPFDIFTSAVNAFDSLTEALNILTSDSSNAEPLSNVIVGTVNIENGAVIATPGTVTEEFKITSIE